jgi:hypothetical protein
MNLGFKVIVQLESFEFLNNWRHCFKATLPPGLLCL